MKQIFIVGCSRSGTSVLQKKLVESTGLYSCPETAFFSISNENRKNRLSNLRRLITYTELFDASNSDCFSEKYILPALELLGISATEFIESGTKEFNVFADIMEKASLLSYKNGWIEKTPLHFIRAEEILKKFPNASVIFVIRNGIDVAASIRDRANKFSEFAHQKDLNVAVNLWNLSLKKADSLKYSSRVHLLNYDDFVQNSEVHVKEILAKFQLELSQNNDTSSNVNIVNDNEKWKKGLQGPITPQKSRVNDVFSEEEKTILMEKLNYKLYKKLFDSGQ